MRIALARTCGSRKVMPELRYCAVSGRDLNFTQGVFVRAYAWDGATEDLDFCLTLNGHEKKQQNA